MQQIHVDVVELELLERLADGCLNVRRLLPPHLGDDEHVRTTLTLLEALLQSLTDDLLVAINGGRVNVAVANLHNSISDTLDEML